MLSGKELKKARKNMGLTQKSLAAELGVSLPTVVNWELGKSVPRGKNLQKLEKFFTAYTAEPVVVESKAVDQDMPELAAVAEDLGFADVQEMFRNIIRRHKLGMLDL